MTAIPGMEMAVTDTDTDTLRKANPPPCQTHDIEWQTPTTADLPVKNVPLRAPDDGRRGPAQGRAARMIPDIDIHHSAWLIIRRYGDDAVIQAAMRGDQLLAMGDLDGMLVWVAIVRAIERLQVGSPAEGETVH